MVRSLTSAMLGCLLALAASAAEAKPKVISAGEWSCSGPWTRKTVTNADDNKKYNCDCQTCTREVCVEDAGAVRCGAKETHSCLEPRNCTAALVTPTPGLSTTIRPDVLQLDPGPKPKPKVYPFQTSPGILQQQ
jgi:hypothetical protein